MNDKQEGILFTIDCLNSHKYNFDYNLEELIKEAKKLQSNWNSLREWLKATLTNEEFCYLAENAKDRCRYDVFNEVLDKMNELEGKDKE